MTRLEQLLPFWLTSVVARLEVVFEELQRCNEHPFRGNAMHEAFPILHCPEGLQQMALPVYRAYVREQLDRACSRKPTDLLTDAEVLAALSAASLRAPLDRNHAALMGELFTKIMESPVEGLATETYPGAAGELLAAFKRKKRTPWA